MGDIHVVPHGPQRGRRIGRGCLTPSFPPAHRPAKIPARSPQTITYFNPVTTRAFFCITPLHPV
ncbi:hypothetical protein E2C01_022568 [Portunus trituberculatus]|uniref:Uncharacterized protein n=1 Tax=Portunus trituberculatus TaxID=210409 RepID=A0A5B7E5Q7_PORTR|nr:hypothetical protein [Portunus trituberculatus]